MKTSKTILRIALSAIIIVLSYQNSYSQFSEWHKAGTHPDDYEMKIVNDIKHSGNRSLFISSLKDNIDGFGTYMQTFKADKYLGKRIKLTGWIKTKDADAVQMWVRLDNQDKMTGYANMNDKPIEGSSDWKEYSIVLDIPQGTVFIAFGTLVSGPGTAWVDDYKIEVVNKNVPTTSMEIDELLGIEEYHIKVDEEKAEWNEYLKTKFPTKPQNMGFEN